MKRLQVGNWISGGGAVLSCLFLGLAPASAQGFDMSEGEGRRGTALPFDTSTWPTERGLGPADDSETLAWQSAVAPEEGQGMSWTLGTYLFASSIDGTTVVGESTVDLDVAFSDLFHRLKVPFALHGEGRHGKWGFGFDVLYIVVEDDDLASGSIPEPLTASGEFTINNLEVFGTYRLGNENAPSGGLDLVVGVQQRRLRLELLVIGLPQSVTAGFDESWWDFMVGGRWVKRLHPRVGMVLRADFGADVYKVNGGISLNVWRALEALIEYRYMKFSRSQGAGDTLFVYDASESGPLLGLGFHF